jgi:hypothetical protein
MSIKESLCQSAIAVFVPWSLVVLTLVPGNPGAVVLALGPAALAAVALNLANLWLAAATTLAGDAALVVILAWVARRSQAALIVLGLVNFALAVWLTAAMRG